MRQISSRSTIFTKWIVPFLFCGFLLVFAGISVSDGTLEQDPLFLLGPFLGLVFSLAMFRFYLWNLADTVFDHGTYLVAKRRGIEARVPLDNIMNVSSSALSNPKRVTLRLVKPCALGSEIAFIPKTAFTFNPFAKVAVAENLMERAFAARARSVV
jgi:hypothetical protein